MINAIIIYIEYLSIVKCSKIYTSKKKLLLFSKKRITTEAQRYRGGGYGCLVA